MKKSQDEYKENMALSALPESQEGITVDPDMDSMLMVCEYVEGTMEKAGLGMREISKVNIAVDELFSNIAQYSKAQHAQIVCRVNEEQVSVSFIDDGRPYNPLSTDDPDITLSAEEREIGGLGIFMTRKLMSDITYDYIDSKNMVTIYLNRN